MKRLKLVFEINHLFVALSVFVWAMVVFIVIIENNGSESIELNCFIHNIIGGVKPIGQLDLMGSIRYTAITVVPIIYNMNKFIKKINFRFYMEIYRLCSYRKWWNQVVFSVILNSLAYYVIGLVISLVTGILISDEIQTIKILEWLLLPIYIIFASLICVVLSIRFKTTSIYLALVLVLGISCVVGSRSQGFNPWLLGCYGMINQCNDNKSLFLWISLQILICILLGYWGVVFLKHQNNKGVQKL